MRPEHAVALKCAVIRKATPPRNLLVDGHSTGVFSSRKLEMATYVSVAFRYIAVGTHPDHDILATFRKRFIDEIEMVPTNRPKSFVLASTPVHA